MGSVKSNPTAEWLGRILKDLEKASGYSYKEGESVPDGKAFAYGLAIGYLSNLKYEWEQPREESKKT